MSCACHDVGADQDLNVLTSSGLLFPVVGAAGAAAFSAVGGVEMLPPPPKSFSLRSRSWTRSSAVAFGGMVCRGVTPSTAGAGGSCRAAAGFACSIIMFVRSAETTQQAEGYKTLPTSDPILSVFFAFRFFDFAGAFCNRSRLRIASRLVHDTARLIDEPKTKSTLEFEALIAVALKSLAEAPQSSRRVRSAPMYA